MYILFFKIQIKLEFLSVEMEVMYKNNDYFIF